MDLSDARQAQEWARKLRPNDPLRVTAEHVLAGGTLPASAAEEAVLRLAEPHRFRWQAVALSALLLSVSDIGGAEQSRALRLLRGLACRRTHRGALRACGRGLLRGGAIATILIGVAAVINNVLAAFYGAEAVEDVFLPWPGIAWAVLSLLLCGAAAFVVIGAPLVAPSMDQAAGDHIREAAVAALGRMRDVESVGLLAAASCERGPVRYMAATTLLRVLPAITPEHYGALPPGGVPQLCRALLAHANVRHAVWRYDRDLAEAILTALERAGDGRAVSAVQRVAADSLSEVLRNRAAEVLSVLQARQVQERDSGRLLRPAGAPDTDVLLRPAEPGAATPPEELLRPVE